MQRKTLTVGGRMVWRGAMEIKYEDLRRRLVDGMVSKRVKKEGHR